jgi:hypothetical protein
MCAPGGYIMRKLVAIILCAVTIAWIPANASGTENKFSDVQTTDWYYESVIYATENALLTGTSADKFSPAVEMTRGMFVTVLYNQAKKLGKDVSVKNPAGFTDLTQDWYKEAVAWAAENNIVSGITKTTFAPGMPISREQMCVILVNFLEKYLGYNLTEYAGVLSFPDKGKVSAYALDAVAKACNLGLITGRETSEGKMLAPGAGSARCEVATVMMLENKLLPKLEAAKTDSGSSTSVGGASSGGGSSTPTHTTEEIALENTIAGYLKTMVTNYNSLSVRDKKARECLDVLMNTLSNALSAHNNGAFLDKSYVNDNYSEQVNKFRSMHDALTDEQTKEFNNIVVRLEDTDHIKAVMDYFDVSSTYYPG